MLNEFGKLYFRQFRSAVVDWQKNPLHKQSILLQKVIHQSHNTLIGKTYQTPDIRTYKDFAGRIPIVEYDTFKPFIDQVVRQEPNILIPGKITWFAKSSGTTDASKFIPTSDAFFQRGHYLAAKHAMCQYLQCHPNSRLFTGKQILMVGSIAKHSEQKIHVGDLSALLVHNAPFIRDLFTSPDLNTMTMDNWEKKIPLIAKATTNQNITGIAGVPTWTIAFIHYLLQTKNKSSLCEIWENFELYISGGVAYKPYVQIMQQLIGKSFNALETYNASEGFFAAQSCPEDNEGMLLYPDHGTFFEFMNTENHADIVPLEGVELNKNYALVISNLSGLYRYIIGDTIKFTSLRPYKIVITGRLKQFINAVGEELMVHNADDAITKVVRELKIDVCDYSAAPCFPSIQKKAYHEWIIATHEPLSPEQKEMFTQKLDEYLCLVNSDYQSKRQNDMGLLMPHIHFVGATFFETWLKTKGRMGGQNKVPRLDNSRKYIDDMLSLSSKTRTIE